jgi:hypothetical protein
MDVSQLPLTQQREFAFFLAITLAVTSKYRIVHQIQAVVSSDIDLAFFEDTIETALGDLQQKVFDAILSRTRKGFGTFLDIKAICRYMSAEDYAEAYTAALLGAD